MLLLILIMKVKNLILIRNVSTAALKCRQHLTFNRALQYTPEPTNIKNKEFQYIIGRINCTVMGDDITNTKGEKS